LEGKQKDLYHKVDKLILNKELNQSAKVMAALASESVNLFIFYVYNYNKSIFIIVYIPTVFFFKP